MFRVDRNNSRVPDVQAEEQSFRFGRSVRDALGVVRSSDGQRTAMMSWKLVRIAEAFMAGLFGRERPHPRWRPRGQIVDVAENGLHWYEAQLVPANAVSAPPPVFTRVALQRVQRGDGDNEREGAKKRRRD